MVYYQPKVDLRDYRLRGAEALVRWRHEGTMIFPDDFTFFLRHGRWLCVGLLQSVSSSLHHGEQRLWWIVLTKTSIWRKEA